MQNYPFLSIIQKCYVKQIYTENFYTTEYSCNMDCRIAVFIGLLTIYIHGTPSNFESSFHPDNDKPRLARTPPGAGPGRPVLSRGGEAVRRLRALRLPRHHRHGGGLRCTVSDV